jgi:hypothetical protein
VKLMALTLGACAPLGLRAPATGVVSARVSVLEIPRPDVGGKRRPAVSNVPDADWCPAGVGFGARMDGTPRLQQLQDRLADLRARMEDNRVRTAALADAVERVQRESVLRRPRVPQRPARSDVFSAAGELEL